MYKDLVAAGLQRWQHLEVSAGGTTPTKCHTRTDSIFPLSILYLQKVRGFGYTDIGLILGGFSIAMVAAEIPTGYLGDRLGRRATLALSNLVGAGFMLGYVVVETPLGYLSLYGVWAVGWAFRSGTRDAWLYELLNRTDDEDTFATVSGRATAVELGIEAVSALAVGALATFSWGLPFLANAGVAALGLPLLLTLPETHGLQDDSTSSADASDEEELPVDTPGQADTGLTIHAALRALRTQIGQKGDSLVRRLRGAVSRFVLGHTNVRTASSGPCRRVGRWARRALRGIQTCVCQRRLSGGPPSEYLRNKTCVRTLGNSLRHRLGYNCIPSGTRPSSPLP